MSLWSNASATQKADKPTLAAMLYKGMGLSHADGHFEGER